MNRAFREPSFGPFNYYPAGLDHLSIVVANSIKLPNRPGGHRMIVEYRLAGDPITQVFICGDAPIEMIWWHCVKATPS